MDTISNAISKAGGQTGLARQLNVSPQAVQQWKSRNKIPAERVLEVERITGIPRHELRPDLYPQETERT